MTSVIEDFLRAAHTNRIRRDLRVDRFQRDATPQAKVVRRVDDAHAALADLLDDAIVRDRASDQVADYTRA
jgi:hypothetical protein